MAHALYRLSRWLGVKGTMGPADFLVYTEPPQQTPEQVWGALCTIFDAHNATVASEGAEG